MNTTTAEQTLTAWQPDRDMTGTKRQWYLTIAEAARIVHRRPYPLLVAIERGELVGFQPGGRGAWLIRPDDLRAYVEGTA